jgi:cytosine/adenosine deaminase-related metal-dependent hydrolase
VTLELAGRIVPLAPNNPSRSFDGRVRFTEAAGVGNQGRFSGGVIAYTKTKRVKPTDGTRYVDVGDAYVYPGLIDLHSHIGYNALPLWRLASRTTPWLHRDQWPGAATYKELVSWPAYAFLKGAPEALMAYVQVRALAGGTTAIQGWPPANGSPANKLVRNVDDDVGSDLIRTSVINLDVSQLRQRAQLMAEGKASLIYHLSEGQPDSKVAKEFDDAAQAGALRRRLIAIHCTAVDDDGFARWRKLADLDDKSHPGGIVWSPFSNLWLYGQTTKVEEAFANGVRVALGSDWGPSGSKNLLGELKVAKAWVTRAGLSQRIKDKDLVAMVTSTPGDLLAQAWGIQLGRLIPEAAGDAAVIARRQTDPWSNLIAARESDVLLVIKDGQPVYGTRALMRAAGATFTTAVQIGSQRRHVPLRQPTDRSKLWTWKTVLTELNRVVADPHHAIDQAHNALALALASSDPKALVPSLGGMLVLEPDMPGGAHAIAGPPPPGAVFTMTKPPSLAHDRAWFRSLPTDGFDAGLLAQTADYFGF